MLKVFSPSEFRKYGNIPREVNGTLVLSTPIASGTAFWGMDVAAFPYPLPIYSEGDILQWALLVETPTPPVGMRLAIQDARGSPNNLAFPKKHSDFFEVPEERSWVLSEPITIDFYEPRGTIYFKWGDIDKEVHVYQLVLGDPDSVAQYIQRKQRSKVLEEWWPASPSVGPPLPKWMGILWPWYRV